MQYIHAYPRTAEFIRNHSPIHADKLLNNPNEAYRNLGRQCQDIQIGETITKIIDLCLNCPAGRDADLRHDLEDIFRVCKDEDCRAHVELDIAESVVDCLLLEIQEQLKNNPKHQVELAKKLPRELAKMIVGYNSGNGDLEQIASVLYNIYNYTESEHFDSSYDLSDGDDIDI